MKAALLTLSLLRCDRCGRFTRRLHAVPTNPPEGGWDREECCKCHGCPTDRKPIPTKPRRTAVQA